MRNCVHDFLYTSKQNNIIILNINGYLAFPLAVVVACFPHGLPLPQFALHVLKGTIVGFVIA